MNKERILGEAILGQIGELRAEVLTIKGMLAEVISHQSEETPKEVDQRWEEKMEEVRKAIVSLALDEIRPPGRK